MDDRAYYDQIDPTADAVVRGYPSVPRVLVLDSGVATVFDADETVAIEEKLNAPDPHGLVAEGPVALTRSDHVCPDTSERVRITLDLGPFFADHPEAMLCAELIGPETPYTTHDYADGSREAIRVSGSEAARPPPH